MGLDDLIEYTASFADEDDRDRWIKKHYPRTAQCADEGMENVLLCPDGTSLTVRGTQVSIIELAAFV